jgi:hypothetical protein
MNEDVGVMMWYVGDEGGVTQVKAFKRYQQDQKMWWVPSQGWTVHEGAGIFVTEQAALDGAAERCRKEKDKWYDLWDKAERAARAWRHR